MKVMVTRNSAIVISRLRAKSATGCSISKHIDVGDHRPVKAINGHGAAGLEDFNSEIAGCLGQAWLEFESGVDVVVVDRLKQHGGPEGAHRSQLAFGHVAEVAGGRQVGAFVLDKGRASVRIRLSAATT